VLARLDPLLATPIELTGPEFNALVAFVGHGLLDPRAVKANLCRLVPRRVPSGMQVMRFQGCGPGHEADR
jgi:hypothetical protein